MATKTQHMTITKREQTRKLAFSESSKQVTNELSVEQIDSKFSMAILTDRTKLYESLEIPGELFQEDGCSLNYDNPERIILKLKSGLPIAITASQLKTAQERVKEMQGRKSRLSVIHVKAYPNGK